MRVQVSPQTPKKIILGDRQMLILAVGDLHGEFGKLNSLINKLNPAIILQCGDFGWWPRFHGQEYRTGYMKTRVWDQYALKNKNTKIFWCPGNHEDWEELSKISEDNNEVMPGVYYMERGYIIELPDGRKVLFMGGALSIDRDDRIHRSGCFGWFEEETISQKDIEDLPDEKIDIVISHTAPEEFKVKGDYHSDFDDPSRKALSYVLNKYKPNLWYFGHIHRYQKGKYNNCVWTCLSATQYDDAWWCKLKEK